ncbi:MAG TPA: hypothetical protein DCQ98_19680 [Planctomycetaceae bacterium]|nr:hypothetical protein [Planctomycetaceae bacterium]HRF02333.1 phytanoyl-CoA dioxygenase family protein [Pirellulaceae bacterium]
MNDRTAFSAWIPTSENADPIASYHRDGFVVLRRLFDPSTIAAADRDAQRLLVERSDLMSERNLRCRYRTDVSNGASVFETFDPVIDLAESIARIALAPTLLAFLERIYGEPAHLFKDKLIYKPPGIEGYPLHQDYIAWPGFPRSFLTVLVPFERADVENGCTVCWTGYHATGALTPEDGTFRPLDPADFDARRQVPLCLDPGDVAIFSGFTPHHSEPNRSARWRRQLYLSYNAERDGGDRRAAHYAEFHAWMRERLGPRGDDVFFR